MHTAVGRGDPSIEQAHPSAPKDATVACTVREWLAPASMRCSDQVFVPVPSPAAIFRFTEPVPVGSTGAQAWPKSWYAWPGSEQVVKVIR